MNHAEYLQEMLSYYDGPLNPVHNAGAVEHLAGFEANFLTEGHWFREVVLDMQMALAGRQVLEVACGHGRWSIYAADTAEKLIATDNSPRLLEAARQIAERKGLLPEKLMFLEADAFGLASVAGEYSGALVMNFLQHIPLASHTNFLEGLHQKLLPGSIIFIGANRFNTDNLQAMPESSDMYGVRTRPDGSTYQIIDNDLGSD